MKHLDLFSGIGGFALAAQEVWGDEYECVGFCEIDKYCQQLLKLRFPKVRVYEDVRTISRERLVADSDCDRCAGWDTKINTAETGEQTFYDAQGCDRIIANSDTKRLQESRAKQQTDRDRQLFETTANTQGRKPGQPSKWQGRKDTPRGDCKIDLLTGGFPCQPFSQAGKRKGTADNRHLWPEMLRTIRDIQTTWVIAENVRGILTIEGGLVFEQVCLDLESAGYEVQPFIIPACAVNAPHRRDRVWIVANRRCEHGARAEKSGEPSRQICGTEDAVVLERSISNASDTCDKGLEGWSKQREGLPGQQDRNGSDERRVWQQNWLEVATKLCGMDDGLPAELDGFKLSKSQHRVQRLKALGNAIVPQVAIEIMRAIKQSLSPHRRDDEVNGMIG